MTIQQFLAFATTSLEKAGVPNARLDCLVLLEDVLKTDRAIVLAHQDRLINRGQLSKLNKLIAQRQRHLPLAYIRGKAPFYGREFIIDTRVLVPRPETETMIEMLLGLDLPDHPMLADVGTGSGCIGITAALELPEASIQLYDVDPGALQIARRNAKAHGANVSCHQSDLLEKVKKADVILANLPYVPERYVINQAAEHEPKHAIFGGKDGLNLYRQLWSQIATPLPRFVLTEALPPQHGELADIARTAGYALRDSRDFIQVFKRI